MSNFKEKRLIFREKDPQAAEESAFWRNVPKDYGSCGIGFVVTKEATRTAIEMALQGLCGMKDRTGEAFKVGDGAGVIFETESARDFYERFLPGGKHLEESDKLSVGMFFFEPELGGNPKNQKRRIEVIMKQQGIHVHGWRKVPFNDDVLPAHMKNQVHYRWQLLYSPPSGMPKYLYNRQLFYAQQRIEREVAGAYPVSLNSGTITYKAKATPGQFKGLYPDLHDPDLVTRQMGFHARMGTNTTVTEPNTQPFRVLWHNGELVSDAAQSSAQADFERRVGMTGAHENCVTVSRGRSDSSHADGMVQALTLHRIITRGALRRRMLPARDDQLRGSGETLRYHDLIWRTQGPLAAMQGPGAIVVMTGHKVHVAMDPLGLRTFGIYGKEGLIVGSSEIGSPPLPIEELEFVHTLEGGQMASIVDGRLTLGEDLEQLMATRAGLALHGDSRLFDLNLAPYSRSPELLSTEQTIKLWNHVGGEQYVVEVLRHMAAYAKEPIEGMGDVRPLAILSPGRLRTAEYFTQVVGVVTDPPMDSLREGVTMDTRVTLGKPPKQVDVNDPNKFEATPEFKMDSPFLNPAQMEEIISGNKLTNGDKPKHVIIDTTFDGKTGAELEAKLDEIIEEVVGMAEEGEQPIIIFSDERCQNEERLFVPPAFIASGVHQALRAKGYRDNVKLVFDTMDALESHDMALLIAQGADAVYPGLLWDAVINDQIEYQKGEEFKKAIDKGGIAEISLRERMINVQQSLNESLRVIMSKHGVISINGYRGSCLFEILGIDTRLSQKYFPYNVSRISGLDFDDLVEDQTERLKEKRTGLRTVREASSRKGKIMMYLNQILLKDKVASPEEAYAKLIEYIENERDPVFLRDLLGFVWAEQREGQELLTSDVESVASIICRHFRGAQMSDGAIGPVAHAAIAAAINELADELMPQLGESAEADKGYSDRLDPRPKSGSGEGGEDPCRYLGGDFEEACSYSKQIASGRFGMDAYYIMSVGDDGELNIKIGQGAKPGEGGHVKGSKIDDRLAAQRGTQPGVELVSPPTQHDIYSIEDLMRLIWDIRAVHPKIKTVSVKVTTKAGIGTIAVGVAKSGADKAILSGREGGTGAAKSSAIRHTGTPLELGIMEAFRALQEVGMVDKIRLEVDGGIVTGSDIVKLAIMGADEFGFGTSILQGGEGCILCKACHDGSAETGCPVGICIQNAEALARLGLGAKAEKYLSQGGDILQFADQFVKCKAAIKHYWTLVAKDVQQILAKLGVNSLEECRGRYELLKRIKRNHKSDKVDLGFIWNDAVKPEDIPDFGDMAINMKNPVNEINQQMIDAAMAYSGEGPFEMEIDLPGVADPDTFDPEMTMRTIGGTLAGLIASGKVKPPKDGFNFRFNGYVGQSFGFCMVDGIRLELQGIGRDFIGSGMCGGKIVVKPPEHLKSFEPVPLAGASCAYGMRGGKLFVAGKVGQRFGVRSCLNATMVCEGTGKWAFEYMTGGTGVVLGDVGNQVGSGMSAGELFLWNGDGGIEDRLFKGDEKPSWMDEEDWKTRKQNVPQIVPMDEADYAKLRGLIEEFYADTGSLRAQIILETWDEFKNHFVKVVPKNKPKPPQPSERGRERLTQLGEFPMIRRKSAEVS